MTYRKVGVLHHFVFKRFGFTFYWRSKNRQRVNTNSVREAIVSAS